MMKLAILTGALVAGVGVSANAQQVFMAPEGRAAIELSQVGGAVRMALETRVTPNAPYSADSITEFVQALADGNRIVRRTTTRLYRDNDGRTRREMLNDAGEITEIVITDPLAGANSVLHPASRTAQRMAGGLARVMANNANGQASTFTMVVPSGGESRARVRPEDGTRVIVREQAEEEMKRMTEAMKIMRTERERAAGPAPTKEDLGDQTVEGVSAHGTRTTTTIPAGAMGNELPLVTISEQWFSNELQMLVMTRHSDPRLGETTYRLTNIRRGEPDRSLFQVPTDYTVK